MSRKPTTGVLQTSWCGMESAGTTRHLSMCANVKSPQQSTKKCCRPLPRHSCVTVLTKLFFIKIITRRTAHKTQDYMQQQHVTIPPWLSISPDSSPIEHCGTTWVVSMIATYRLVISCKQLSYNEAINLKLLSQD